MVFAFAIDFAVAFAVAFAFAFAQAFAIDFVVAFAFAFAFAFASTSLLYSLSPLPSRCVQVAFAFVVRASARRIRFDNVSRCVQVAFDFVVRASALVMYVAFAVDTPMSHSIWQCIALPSLVLHIIRYILARCCI